MTTLILDIETVGLPLDDAQINELTKRCKNTDERVAVLNATALNPLTGKICCIGLKNYERGSAIDTGPDEEFIIRCFWDRVVSADLVVTFNGRGFDLPFIMILSAILSIRPSRRDLMGYRYAAIPHCDLYEQMTYYGATRGKFSLDLVCRAMGIKSPKENSNGGEVEKMFAAGDYDGITNYNAGDLEAIALLYHRWLNFMKPPRA